MDSSYTDSPETWELTERNKSTLCACRWIFENEVVE